MSVLQSREWVLVFSYEAWIFFSERICKIVNFLITENLHMDKHKEKSGGEELDSYIKIKFVHMHVKYVRYDEISFVQVHVKV